MDVERRRGEAVRLGVRERWRTSARVMSKEEPELLAADVRAVGDCEAWVVRCG